MGLVQEDERNEEARRLRKGNGRRGFGESEL